MESPPQSSDSLAGCWPLAGLGLAVIDLAAAMNALRTVGTSGVSMYRRRVFHTFDRAMSDGYLEAISTCLVQQKLKPDKTFSADTRFFLVKGGMMVLCTIEGLHVDANLSRHYHSLDVGN